jgi:two-component system sensor histidine kinase YesM
MKLGIKAKILGATGIVVVISLMLSGTIAYYYFLKIFKEKAIKDDIAKLDQIAQQMEYQTDDIKKLAISIIIIPEVQAFIKQNHYPGYYEQLIDARKTLGLMINQIFLREYIHSAAVITHNGSVWYTDLHTMPHDYFKGKLAENWYQKYLLNQGQFYFSDPYDISNVTRGTPSEKVMGYIVQFHDVDSPEKIVGLLILNVYLDHFQKNLKRNSTDYDALYWINRDGGVIFGKNLTPNDITPPEILSQVKSGVPNNKETKNPPVKKNPNVSESSNGFENPNVIENHNGYMVINRSATSGWTLISFTSNRKLFHRIGFIFYFFLCFTFLSVAVILGVVFMMILRFTGPITQLTQAMKQVAGGNLDTTVDITSGDELETMAHGFNRMVLDLKNHLSASLEYEKYKRKMEYDILLSQINPHFIYNILNTVIYMARKQKNHDIAGLVESFIRILQDGIKVGGEGLLVTIRQEIEIVNHYVAIQQYRYRDRFELIWDVDPSSMDCLIPKTLIQPLVENALYHGICPKDGPGKITVQVSNTEADLIITVTDDGIGMEPETVEKLLSGGQVYEPESKLRSIGIANIRDRIRYLFGEKYGISIESATGLGTRVIVGLPVQLERS